MKTVTTLAIVAMFLCLALGGASAQSGGAGAFSRDDWLADYSYLKLQLEGQYSHLAWLTPSDRDDKLLRVPKAELELVSQRFPDWIYKPLVVRILPLVPA